MITGLKIENFKRIVAVNLTINPDGSVVEIAGRNGQGKSSILDAIMVALVGRAAMPDAPVRKGEEAASIALSVDGYTVTRTIKPDGSGTVKITAADGSVRPRPQEWLDAKIGRLAFDPAAFMLAKPAEQADTLRRLTGVDVSDLDARKSALYSERTGIGRERDAARGAAAAMPYHADAPDAEVSVAGLIAKQQDAAAKQRARDDAARRAADARSAAAAKAARIAELDAEIARAAEDAAAEVARLEAMITAAKATAAARIADATNRKNNNANAITQHNAEARAADDEAAAIVVPDVASIAEQIAGAEAANRKVRENAARAAAKARADRLAGDYDAATVALDTIAAERAARIAAAKMPIDGLGFGEDGTVTFGGIPLTQASQSEKIRVSMSIALAMAPEIKIALIRDGSLLDDDARALVAKIAAENGAQVWMEVVGRGDAGAIVIEDGAVSA